VHSTIIETPSACWKRSIQSIKIRTVSDEKAFLVDFLPVIKRTISRTGFTVDYITYYADLLKPWIANRDYLERFVIRRDPRDLSRIWVLDPQSNNYFEVPYRTTSNPAVTLWEHKRALQKLREAGRAQVDELAIFRMVQQMRDIAATAQKERKQARRDRARRSHLAKNAQPIVQFAEAEGSENRNVEPFEDLEEW
jgi:putative transposase